MPADSDRSRYATFTFFGSLLAGMVERSRLLGGQISIESAPDAGTSVTVSLPLAAATVAG